MGPQWIGATEHNRWLAWETRALLRYARSAAVPSGFGWIGEDGSVDTSHPVELWITGRMTFAFSIGTQPLRRPRRARARQRSERP